MSDVTLPRYCPQCCRTPVAHYDAVTYATELRCPRKGTVLARVTDKERATLSEMTQRWLGGLAGV